MKRVLFLCCAALIAGSVSAEPVRVRLDAATQARLQIRTARIETAHSSGAVNGFATVMDPSPLLQLLSDLATAKAALAASQAEAARTKGLAQDATVSAKIAEAARAQALADQAKVTLLRQRLGLEWGPYFANLPDSAMAQLAQDIAASQTALVRVDTPSGQGMKTASSVEIDLGPLGSASGRVAGVARTADQRLQSPGLITIVTGSQAAYLNNGLTLNAKLYGGSGTDGLLIPNAALLRQGGHVYAYVKTAQGFEKREVRAARILPDGLIVKDGFGAGETIVVQGASALLTAENTHPAED